MKPHSCDNRWKWSLGTGLVNSSGGGKMKSSFAEAWTDAKVQDVRTASFGAHGD